MTQNFQKIIQESMRDCETVGKAANELGYATPRYGNRFKTIPQLSMEFQQVVQEALSAGQNLQQAINIALAAGAGQAGWTASLVVDASGKSQQKINDGLDSISELLSISAKEGSRHYVKGRQAGWFKYNKSRIHENDGGTIFNGWERIDFQVITFDMFDCDSNGVVAIDDKLLKICAASTALKKPVHNFTGTYLVNSSNEFIFTENTLLDGSIIKLGSSFTGKFIFTRDDVEEIELTSGTDFDALKSVGVLQKGRYRLSATAFSKYADYFMKVETSQPLYIYRSEIKTSKFYTRILKDRYLLSAPAFDLDLAQTTKIKLQRVAKSIRLFSGLTFDETDCDTLSDYMHIKNGNMIASRNIRYINNKQSNIADNRTRLTVDAVNHIRFNSIDCVSSEANASGTYNYSLTLTDSYDIVIDDMQSFGGGWGATGSNNCARVEFKNSNVNRIDFHEPCYEYLKVTNCNVGGWGVICTMIGDLHIDDSSIITYEAAVNRGYIRSRSDTGGFCFGDLHINNLKLLGYNGNNIELIVAQGDGVLPAGSPLLPIMFEKIMIDNIDCKQTNSLVSGLLTATTASTLLQPPRKIAVDRLTNFNPVIDFGKFAKRNDTVRLDFLNVDNNHLYISDSTQVGTKIKAKVFNLNNNGLMSRILNTANCDIDIIGSTLEYYREYNVIWNSFNPQVTISDSQMSVDEYVSLNTGVTNNRVTLRGIRFTNPTPASILGMAPKAKHYNCTFSGSAYATVWSGTGVNTGSFNVHVSSGIIDLIVWYGSNKKFISIDPSVAKTYTIETGVTIVITIEGVTATVTLNATDSKLLAIRNVV